MKQFLIVLLALLVVGTVDAQNQPQQTANAFIPNGLYGGSMISKALSTTYADTTQSFGVRNWGKAYVGVEVAANDSANVLIQYSTSKDGINFSAYTTLDSLVSTGTVGVWKYTELPANVMGAYSVRIRVAGQAHGAYSSSPSATVTTKIIRKHQ